MAFADAYRSVVSEVERFIESPRDFEEMAFRVFEFQMKWNASYANFCEGKSFDDWKSIPAVSTAAFKDSERMVCCFPIGEAECFFETSGTTGEVRGRHYFLDTELYRRSIDGGVARLNLPDGLERFWLPGLGENSSLAFMLEYLSGHESGFSSEACDQPVLLMGAALSFLHLFENGCDPLPEGSWAMETGGYKGSGREISKSDLYSMFEDHLGIPGGRMINEYGMTELASQFYARGVDGFHSGGPWVRAVVRSPETGEEVEVGEAGYLSIYDLANVGSVMAVATQDIAVRGEGGAFQLIGRDPRRSLGDVRGRRMSFYLGDEVFGNYGALSRQQAATNRQRQQAARSPRRLRLGEIMMRERAELIVAAAGGFEGFLGELRVDDLMRLVELEVGSLDEFVPWGDVNSKAIAPGIILHVVSGNSPHAGMQSLVRGVLLGSRNLVKISKGGGAEIEAFAAALDCGVEVSESLPDEWLDEAEVVVVFGSDETVEHFREQVRPDQVFVAHGHKVSFSVVLEAGGEAAALAARDVSLFDQQGCLSPHCIYVAGDAKQFAASLAEEMAKFDAHTPRRDLSLGESAELMHLRSSYSFREASDSRVKVWHSDGNTHWTVIYEEESQFAVSCLNRVVFVKPLPPAEALPGALAMVRDHLSTIGLWPFSLEAAEKLAGYGASRICPLGQAQEPSIFWHQDGGQVLAPLVHWVDAG